VKIAVASEDGVSISQHFGRSRCFLVYEVDDQKILGYSVRDNTFTAHARGECQEGVEHNHQHGHAAIVEALKDCEAVLCYGMGWRAAEELKQNGIQAFLVPTDM
jgi:predicted Fe-Mo cluster-binding NifX family protein